MKKVTTYQNTQTEIDHKTGEINKTTEFKSVRIPKEPPFIKLYLTHIQVTLKLTGTATKLVLRLLKTMNYDNQIILNSSIKKIICKELNIDIGALDNTLTLLRKPREELGGKGVFIPIAQGILEPNPALFTRKSWTGNWERIEELQITHVFNKNGHQIASTSAIEKANLPKVNPFDELECLDNEDIPF